jgi:hypothetical protein
LMVQRLARVHRGLKLQPRQARTVTDEVLRRNPLTVEPLPSGTSVSVQFREVDKPLVPHRRLVSPRTEFLYEFGNRPVDTSILEERPWGASGRTLLAPTG